eukprot:1008011-Rhodomonas_salina.3
MTSNPVSRIVPAYNAVSAWHFSSPLARCAVPAGLSRIGLSWMSRNVSVVQVRIAFESHSIPSTEKEFSL